MCSAHNKINLIATSDTKQADEDACYKRSSRSALAKCQALWNKQSSSSLHGDIIKSAFGRYLLKPNDTRWNSLYDSLNCVSKMLKDNEEGVQGVCDQLALPRFRKTDITFIQEYCKVMRPVSVSLDTLQGETKAFMGILLPVLHALKRRLISMRDGGLVILTICLPLVEALITGLDKRFGSLWFRKDLVIASVLHPEFQFNWIKDEDKEVQAKVWVNDVVKQAYTELGRGANEFDLEEVEEEEEDGLLFDFKKPSRKDGARPGWQEELDRYLAFPSGEIKCLHGFTLLKELFIKYNTAIPSSAAVERIFSVGGDIFTKKRGKLADENFEKLLMLKVGLK